MGVSGRIGLIDNVMQNGAYINEFFKELPICGSAA
jgi:hypothetical protein